MGLGLCVGLGLGHGLCQVGLGLGLGHGLCQVGLGLGLSHGLCQVGLALGLGHGLCQVGLGLGLGRGKGLGLMLSKRPPRKSMKKPPLHSLPLYLSSYKNYLRHPSKDPTRTHETLISS